jgi:hypothetical protein
MSGGRSIPALAHLVACGEYDVILGSRILSKRTLAGGMPVYKYIANRFLTLVQNLMLRHKLSEYHTGYRIGEISRPARYEPESSSISFHRSIICGLGVLWTSVQFVIQRLGLARFPIFDPNGRRLI